MEIYIIGASFAGISCALHARKLYPNAKITIIEKKYNGRFFTWWLTIILTK